MRILCISYTHREDRTDLVEVRFQVHSLVQVRDGFLCLTNGKVHRRPLEVGKVVGGITIWRRGGGGGGGGG